MSEYKGVGKRPEELVAGDSVLVTNSEYGKTYKRIVEIEHVTKGGKVRIEGGMLYTIGQAKGYGFSGSVIVTPLTEADVRWAETVALVRKCKAAVAAASLTVWQAEAIMRILEGE